MKKLFYILMMMSLVGCVVEDQDYPPGPTSFYYQAHGDDHHHDHGYTYAAYDSHICYGNIYPYTYNAIDCDYYTGSLTTCCKWFEYGCIVTMCYEDELCGWHFTKEVCDY